MDTSVTRALGPDEDPLDRQLHRLGAAPARGQVLPWHARLGLSWSAGSAPILLLLLVGLAMGPAALALLTPGVLSALDPAVPVALAVLGTHAGLNIGWSRSTAQSRLLALGGIESAVTGVLVATGVLFVLAPNPSVAPFHTWVMALTAGVCGATSAVRVGTDEGGTSRDVEGYGLLLPIAVGGAVLAWVREGDLVPAAWLFVQGLALAVVVALAAWLLLTRTTSDTERHIFGVSAVLLIGGMADYLALSALAGGLAAGVTWRALGGPAAESIQRDVGYLQHPLLVLLLVVAGARVGSPAGLWTLAAAYLVLRLAGKLLGASIGTRVARAPVANGFGLGLVAPGVFGVAFALNSIRAAGAHTESLLTIVVLGTLGAQVIAALWASRELPA